MRTDGASRASASRTRARASPSYCTAASRGRSWQAGGRVFAFEVTGRVWEALAAILEQHGERYVIASPLAVFRLREARRMDRTNVDTPGLLAVVRLGLTPAQIAALPLSEFLTRVCAERGGRRLWRAKVRAAHEKATHSIVSSERLEAAALEARRIVARYDLVAAQLEEIQAEVEALLGEIEEARWLATILASASPRWPASSRTRADRPLPHGDHRLPRPQPAPARPLRPPREPPAAAAREDDGARRLHEQALTLWRSR